MAQAASAERRLLQGVQLDDQARPGLQGGCQVEPSQQSSRQPCDRRLLTPAQPHASLSRLMALVTAYIPPQVTFKVTFKLIDSVMLCYK